MKKTFLTLIPAFAMVCMFAFTSCSDKKSSSSDDEEKTEKTDKDDDEDEDSEASIKGTWEAGKDALLKTMDRDTREALDLTDGTLTMKFTNDKLKVTMDVVAEISQDGMTMGLSMEAEMNYSYTLDGDELECEYISGDAKVRDLSLPEELEEQLAMAGMSTDDIIEAMEQNMDLGKGKDTTFEVVKLTEKKLKLKDDDGQSIEMKRK